MDEKIVGANKIRKPWIAGVLSLVIPGGGQIYNGNLRAGFLVPFLVCLIGYNKLTDIALWGLGWFAFIAITQIAIYIAVFIHAVCGARNAASVRVSRGYHYFLLVGLYLVLSAPIVFFSEKVKTFHIPAASMVPSVFDGDYVVTDLSAFELDRPRPGDLAIFQYPRDPSISYIKRVIAGPGETVEIKNKVLYIDGKKIENIFVPKTEGVKLVSDKDVEKFLEAFQEELNGRKYTVLYNPISKFNSDFGPVKVPENEYFVLGDNRDMSSDSRIWGFVPKENFISKPVYIFFSKEPNTFRIRWERLGLRL